MSKLTSYARAFVVTCALAPLPALADAPAREVPTHQVKAQARSIQQASHQEAANYADREQQDHKAVSTFEGGNVIVISGGALLVLLLILLLIL